MVLTASLEGERDYVVVIVATKPVQGALCRR
jgi:hypothetical protein